MDFKKFSVGKYSYGDSNPEKPVLEKGVSNINFECSLFEEHWTNSFEKEGQPSNPELSTFMTILAICHTIIPEKKNDILTYNASSPDELALTNAARHFGIVFQERDDLSNLHIYNKFTNKV